jgi:hypothetical protein
MKEKHRPRRTYRSLLNLFAVLLAFPLLVRHAPPGHAQGGADLVLNGAPLSPVSVTDVFTIAVEVQGNGQPHSVVEVHLNFDQTILSVNSATVVGAATLPFELIPLAFDNSNGTVDYAAGTFSEPPSGTYNLLEVEFQVIDAQSTTIDFAFDIGNNRETVVAYEGIDVLANATGASITATPVALALASATAAAQGSSPAVAALPLLVLSGLSMVVLWRRRAPGS